MMLIEIIKANYKVAIGLIIVGFGLLFLAYKLKN